MIRLLEKDEFILYKNIRLESVRTLSHNFGTTYEEEASADTLKLSHVFFDKETTDFIYGAFEENRLIGICGFVQETKSKTKHNGEITQMYIDPVFSGRGIGSSLLRASIDRAFSDNVIEQIRLTVIASNDRAVDLYKKMGFERYGILENYYKKENTYWTETFMVLTRRKYQNANSSTFRLG